MSCWPMCLTPQSSIQDPSPSLTRPAVAGRPSVRSIPPGTRTRPHLRPRKHAGAAETLVSAADDRCHIVVLEKRRRTRPYQGRPRTLNAVSTLCCGSPERNHPYLARCPARELGNRVPSMRTLVGDGWPLFPTCHMFHGGRHFGQRSRCRSPPLLTDTKLTCA